MSYLSGRALLGQRIATRAQQQAPSSPQQNRALSPTNQHLPKRGHHCQAIAFPQVQLPHAVIGTFGNAGYLNAATSTLAYHAETAIRSLNAQWALVRRLSHPGMETMDVSPPYFPH